MPLARLALFLMRKIRDFLEKDGERIEIVSFLHRRYVVWLVSFFYFYSCFAAFWFMRRKESRAFGFMKTKSGAITPKPARL